MASIKHVEIQNGDTYDIESVNDAALRSELDELKQATPGDFTIGGKLMLNSVSYGTSLPATGTPGQIFIKLES